MTRKDRLFSFIETTLQAIKFRGVWFGVVFVYHAVRMRFMLKEGPGHYSFLGFTMHFDNKWSAINMWFELFGQNAYYFKTAQATPLIIDGGANIGDTIVYFKSLYPDAKIVAYEPNPKAAALLKKNVGQNNLQNVSIEESALGSKEGVITLEDDSSGIYNGGTTSDQVLLHTETTVEMSHITVPVATLTTNDIVKNAERIDLLKLDIEGAESEVLQSLAEILHKVERIILEYHFVKTISGNSFDKIIAQLSESGFKIGAQGLYRTHENILNHRVFLIQGYK